jgi:hypothetical protein
MIIGTDTLMDTMVKMSKGNPGAATVLGRLMPDVIPILTLDQLGVYGSDIWVLFKDVCRQDLDLMTLVLESYNRGWVTKGQIKETLSGMQNPKMGHPSPNLVPIDEIVERFKKEIGNDKAS